MSLFLLQNEGREQRCSATFRTHLKDESHDSKSYISTNGITFMNLSVHPSVMQFFQRILYKRKQAMLRINSIMLYPLGVAERYDQTYEKNYC